jgi:hypothetical protein
MTDQQREESDNMSENESNFGDKSRDYGTPATPADAGGSNEGSADNDGGTSGDYPGGKSGTSSEPSKSEEKTG